MVNIIIQKTKTWFSKEKYHCQIKHVNGNVLLWSEKQFNLKDLEDMLHNLQRDLSKAKITYDFDVEKYDKPSA